MQSAFDAYTQLMHIPKSIWIKFNMSQYESSSIQSESNWYYLINMNHVYYDWFSLSQI